MAGLFQWLLIIYLVIEALMTAILCESIRFCLVPWRRLIALPLVWMLIGLGWDPFFQHNVLGSLGPVGCVARMLFANSLLVYVAMRRRAGHSDGSGQLHTSDLFALITGSAILLAYVMHTLPAAYDMPLTYTLILFEFAAIAMETSILILGMHAYGHVAARLALKTSIVIAAISVVVVISGIDSTGFVLCFSVIGRVIWIVSVAFAFLFDSDRAY